MLYFKFAGLTEANVQELQTCLENLLAKLRPNAVGIVDGFDLTDMELGSALGAYDGNVYERIFDEAMKSPLNREVESKNFKMHLKPFLIKSKM